MKRQKLLALRGKIAWQGDLGQLRADRAGRVAPAEREGRAQRGGGDRRV